MKGSKFGSCLSICDPDPDPDLGF